MNDIDKLSQQLKTEFSAENPDPTEVYRHDEVTEVPTGVTPVESTKGMKSISLFDQETATSSAVGMDYRSVSQELLKPLHRAIMKAGMSSIAKDAMGDFLNAFPVDPGWIREELLETGKYFYVLKNQSREAQIYNIVRQACENTEDDIITIPAVSPVTLVIDEPGVKMELETHALTFTLKELKYIKFAFIKKMEFRYNDEASDPYLEACYVITIDRSKLEAAPFVTDGE